MTTYIPELGDQIFFYITFGIMIYYFFLATWYLISLIYAFPKVIKAFYEFKFGNINQLIAEELIPISIIIPTFNGEKRIFHTIASVLDSSYKNIQIIIVNDGSTDNTLALLQEKFSLYEIPPVIKQTIATSPIQHFYKSKQYNLYVIDKMHHPANTAADSINVGLNATSSPLFMTLDDDTILEKNSLKAIIFSFLSRPNTIAVGGALRAISPLGNESPTNRFETKYLYMLQALEYVRSFTYGRASLDISTGGALCYPGAYSFFETQFVREVGGYDAENPSYDSELIMKLQHVMRKKHYPTNVHFMAGSFAFTEVPLTFKSYWSQRSRWQYGMWKSVFNHIHLLFNYQYGLVGLIFFPAYILFEVLGPVVEFFSYVLFILAILLHLVSWKITLVFILLAWSYIILITIYSYLLDVLTFFCIQGAGIFKIILYVTLEMLGLRQLRAAACFYGTIIFLIEVLKPKK